MESTIFSTWVLRTSSIVNAYWWTIKWDINIFTLCGHSERSTDFFKQISFPLIFQFDSFQVLNYPVKPLATTQKSVIYNFGHFWIQSRQSDVLFEILLIELSSIAVFLGHWWMGFNVAAIHFWLWAAYGMKTSINQVWVFPPQSTNHKKTLECHRCALRCAHQTQSARYHQCSVVGQHVV